MDERDVVRQTASRFLLYLFLKRHFSGTDEHTQAVGNGRNGAIILPAYVGTVRIIGLIEIHDHLIALYIMRGKIDIPSYLVSRFSCTEIREGKKKMILILLELYDALRLVYGHRYCRIVYLEVKHAIDPEGLADRARGLHREPLAIAHFFEACLNPVLFINREEAKPFLRLWGSNHLMFVYIPGTICLHGVEVCALRE